jgi:putative phosphoesterase
MAERLALMGDVHANLPALRAVLNAIAAVGLEQGLCTGDLVMRGDHPEECVSLVRELGWPCVMGNTDRKVANRRRRSKDDPKASRVGSRAWSTNQLSAASMRYLGALPLVRRASLRGLTVVLMHGAPDDPRGGVGEWTPEDELVHLARDLKADCIVSGHTHRPLIRQVDGCLFVNPGSVGEALEGDRRPSWAWLEASRRGLTATLERVPEKLATVRQA